MKFLPMTLDGKPFWYLMLRGAAIPGMIVAACLLIAVIYALFDGLNIKDIVTVGVAVGLFFSLWGGIEIMLGILFYSKDIRTNSFLALGYLIVWSICIYVIFKSLL